MRCNRPPVRRPGAPDAPNQANDSAHKGRHARGTRRELRTIRRRANAKAGTRRASQSGLRGAGTCFEIGFEIGETKNSIRASPSDVAVEAVALETQNARKPNRGDIKSADGRLRIQIRRAEALPYEKHQLMGWCRCGASGLDDRRRSWGRPWAKFFACRSARCAYAESACRDRCQLLCARTLHCATGLSPNQIRMT